jgi:steroid 5-alpha reductase family enzyme
MIFENLVTIALLVVAYMTGWFLWGYYKKRNDVADEAWGLGFIFIALASSILNQASGFKNLIVILLVLFWGGRLYWHISHRHIGKKEDSRYQAFRKDWRENFLLKSFLNIYLLQGLLMLLVSFPIILVNLESRGEFILVNYLGLVIWFVGYWFEVTADDQLKKFISKPENKGKLMTSGLWRYSRHPNYFGEITMWWGIYLISLPHFPYLALVGPITITYLIMFVSGVPMLEEKYKDRKDWQGYAKKTSILFPWLPEK